MVQIAVGACIFVFDTLSYPLVLTQSVLSDPATGFLVPTLRHWLEEPDTRIILHSCDNDLRYFRQYGIHVTNVFDTCLADAVLSHDFSL